MQRHRLLPEVPTADEQGVRHFVAGAWVGFVAPAGVPTELTERLSQALRDAIGTTEIRDKIVQAGFNPRGLPSKPFFEQLRGELDVVRRVGKASEIVLGS